MDELEGLTRNIPCSRQLVLGMVFLSILGCSGCRKPAAPQPLPPPVVEVMEVMGTNVVRSAEFIGQLDSPQNVEVRARVEAFVDKFHFEEGRDVKEGQLLYELDKKPFLQKLAAAQGQLEEAKASLNKYRKDVERLEPLVEERAIPKQDLDNAMAAVDVAEANVTSAEARVEAANLDLSYCDVEAPVSGLIGARQVSVGSLVGKGEPTLLATISTLDPIWFYCSISEVDYLASNRALNKVGKRVSDLPVKLILADGSTHPALGKWVFLDRAVDARTATLRARAEFGNTNGLLRPGMFARARIEVMPDESTILIPQRAVQELQGRMFVWVVDGEQKAFQRAVRMGQRLGSDWIVEEGLQPGERIIVEGLQKALEGSLVQPMTAAELARVTSFQPPKE